MDAVVAFPAAAGASCTPNFSAAGRRRRRRLGLAGVAMTALVIGAAVANDAPAWVRALSFIPAVGAAISLLQVRRNTCVLHASTGHVEADDFSTTRAPAAAAAASRAVAHTIQRDGLLIGVAVAALAASTALVG